MTKPLCLKYSLIILRSKQSPFIKTYLEGVPKSEKVIDRIAGADLLSSTGVSFFSTSPRYVDVRREQRLSTLFFHHILYPAGGARAPYQPVVVRGGRALRRCIYPVPKSTHDPTKCTHPLTVPPESSLSSFQQCSQDVSEALWASADPAQHTFFFSPHHPTGTLFHPYHNAKTMQWNVHEETRRLSSSTPPMTPSSFRRPLSHPALLSKALLSRRRSRLLDNCDSTLSLLVGTIESYLNGFQSSSPLSPFSHDTVPFGRSSVTSSRLQKDRTKRKEAERVEQQKKNEKNSERVCSPNYPTEHCAASSSVLERVASLLNDSHAGFLLFGMGKYNSGLNQDERTLEGNAAAALLSSSFTQLRKDCDEQTIPVSEDSAELQAKKVFARVCREYWGTPDGTETSYPETRCERRVVGYVALRLPEDAVVKIPLPFQKGLEGSRDEAMHQKTSAPMACSTTSTSTSKKCSVSNNGSENFVTLPDVCRLSGGVEPSVPFAVGRHLSFPKKLFPSSFLSSTSGVFTPSSSPSLARALFPHVQFLARITWCDEREPEHVNTDAAWKPENQILEEKKHFSLRGTKDTSVPVWSEDEKIEKCEREHNRCTLKKTLESHHPTAFGSLTVTHRPSEFNGISPGVLGTHLDPLIPAKFRTLAEKKHPARRNLRTEEAADSHVGATTAPSSPSLPFSSSLNAEPSLCSSSRVVIGREDAEVYFIPYRPLLLTIFVPSWAEEMCREQNRARVRKQGGVHQHDYSFPATTSCATGAYPTSPLSRFHFSLRDPTAGKVAKNGSVADRFSSTCEKQEWEKMDDDRVSFPSAFSSGRFTWSKKVQLEEQVNQLAGCSGDSHPSHCSSTNEGGRCQMETGHLTYEVKAFPGDAIYIPRGWGIEARRVVGSCLIDSSSSSGTALLSSSLSSCPEELKGSSSSSSGMNIPRKDMHPSFHLEGRKKVEKKAAKGESFSLGRVQVEVDGFFLLYRPYPVLTNEQASLYVSANYVQSNRITDFYDQGGNKVHHQYE